MRATSPKDSLGGPQKRVKLPKPKFPVGTEVDLSKVVSYNRKPYLRTITRTIIGLARDTIHGMQKDGYFPEMKGKKMLECHKAQLREVFDFMKTADSVVVAGHAPWESQSHNNIANQCYLVGGSGFGAMNYGYYFMFRKNVDGNELIYTFPEALMDESNVEPCVIKKSKKATSA